MRLVKLHYSSNNIYCLLGLDNPTGSIKDITVKGMLDSYKKDGSLLDNSTIIEATSGNTGISLAYYQKEYKYKAIIVMPSSASKERRKMIENYQGELVLVDGGMKECEAKVQELISSIPNSFIFNQFSSLYNPMSHYNLTGPEIYSQLKKIDYLVAGIGTGGTISGTAKYLKEKIKELKVIGVEPLQSPLLTKGVSGPHKIQGIGANFIPLAYQKEYVDEIIDVDDNEAIEMAIITRNRDNLDIGISSGACLLGALTYLEENNIINKNIVCIFPDKGDRYSW